MKAFKHMTAFVLALVIAAALAVTAYLNMDAYGAALLWRDKGVFSDYGYICRPDGQPLQVPRQGVDMTMQ